MFENEKTVFQQKINEITTINKSDKVLEDLIKLNILKAAGKNKTQIKLVEIFNYLGPDKFCDLISIIDGEPITFPDIETFKDTIKISLCYYERYLKGHDWKEIKAALENSGIYSTKYASQCAKLNQFIMALSAEIDSIKAEEQNE